MATGFSRNELDIARKKYFGRFHSFNENNNIFQKIVNFFLTRIYFLKNNILNLKRVFFRSIDKVFLIKNETTKKVWAV